MHKTFPDVPVLNEFQRKRVLVTGGSFFLFFYSWPGLGHDFHTLPHPRGHTPHTSHGMFFLVSVLVAC